MSLFYLTPFCPVPPDINDDLSSSDTLATEGMRVVLNCAAEGNPSPTIAWMREDGKKIRLCSDPDGPGDVKSRGHERFVNGHV